MRCSTCGVEVVEQAVYCHKCGAKIDSSVRSQPGAPYRQEPRPTGKGLLAEAAGAKLGQADEPERPLWEGTYSAKAMLGAWILAGLSTAVLLAVGILVGKSLWWWCVLAAIVFVWAYCILGWARQRLGVSYRLTSQRFFHETGILRHRTDLVEVIDMDDITCEQTLLERLLGVGTVRIISSDRTHPELVIAGIDNVQEVARSMHEARHAERKRRGLHIESI